MGKKTTYKVKNGQIVTSIPQAPNDPVNHPTNGTPLFATFPGFSIKTASFPSGPIYLRHGIHNGPNSGFGLEHIRQEHFSKVQDPDAAAAKAIALVAQILRPGSEIFYEGAVGKRAGRPLVCRSSYGTVVLEKRVDGQNATFYSVVTAFASTNPFGNKVGVL